MSRPFPSARELFARLVPGAAARPGDETTGEHHRAVREAFLTAASLEPARPLGSVVTPIPDDASETAGAAAPVAIPIMPAAPAAAAPARVAIPIMPAAPGAAAAPARAPAAGPVAAPPVPQRRAPTPVLSPTTPPPETPSEPGTPLTGRVAPDNVVRPTRNVDRATDDFFGGLVRRVDDR